MHSHRKATSRISKTMVRERNKKTRRLMKLRVKCRF